jgi:hypothetical protein
MVYPLGGNVFLSGSTWTSVLRSLTPSECSLLALHHLCTVTRSRVCGDDLLVALLSREDFSLSNYVHKLLLPNSYLYCTNQPHSAALLTDYYLSAHYLSDPHRSFLNQ